MKKLLILSLLVMAACKKTESTITPTGASNGGQGYLSCVIDGKPYTFMGKPIGLNPTGVSYGYSRWNNGAGVITRDFWIIGHDIGNKKAAVYITLKTDTSYRFPLNQRISFAEMQQKEIYVQLRGTDFRDAYYYADPTTGWINISRADSIGSGTFGFTAYGLDHNGNRLPDSDSVIVTNGKFDIHN